MKKLKIIDFIITILLIVAVVWGCVYSYKYTGYNRNSPNININAITADKFIDLQKRDPVATGWMIALMVIIVAFFLVHFILKEVYKSKMKSLETMRLEDKNSKFKKEVEEKNLIYKKLSRMFLKYGILLIFILGVVMSILKVF